MSPHEVRSANALLASLADSRETLIRVRPRVVFQLAERHLLRDAYLRLPIPSSSIGSITTLEATIMATLLHLFEPKRIIEFGTFLGYSTRLFLLNTNDAVVTSIDLPAFEDSEVSINTPSDVELRTDGAVNDEYLRSQQSKLGHPYLTNLRIEDHGRLTLIKADSRTLTISDLACEVSPKLIYIDGGHDEGTVSADSALALATLDGSGVLIWHDFESSIHDGVTSFLGQWSEAPQLLAVSGTLLAIAFFGESRGRLQALLAESSGDS